MSWRDAIERVLQDEAGAMHYSAIAQEIIDKQYRTRVGATPANTVAAQLSQPPLRDMLVKVDRGVFRLKSHSTEPQNGATSREEAITNMPASDEMQSAETDVAAEEEMGLINAFGMFWRRSEIFWEPRQVNLLGQQQTGSEPVDFREQVGIYLLYDGNKIVYVGRVTEPRMGTRLREHTRDRHKGRWDRFSWFGVRAVDDAGQLAAVRTESISIKTLIATMEALLIEGLEPPQNRKQGDGFNAVEFTQVTDPKVEMQLQQNMLDQLQRKLRN